MARKPQCKILTQADVEKLWERYYRSRHRCLRDRLVKHYFPWFKAIAVRMAQRLRMEDVDNAVGEACLALSEKIIPSYDGRIPFENYALFCLEKKNIDILRKDKPRPVSIERVDPACILLDPAIPTALYGRVRFTQLTSKLSDKLAIVLWLRFYCGMLIKDVAALLEIPENTVKTRSKIAIEQLQKSSENGEFAV